MKKSKTKPDKSAAKSALPQGKTPSPQEINALIAMFTQGRYAEASILAQMMTMHFPLDGFGWKVLGAVFKQMGRSADALAPMQKAAELSPNDAQAYYNLGVILKELGRLDEAEARYQRALKIKPDYAEAHYNLANTFKELGRLVEAEASYRRTLQIEPGNADAHSNLGATLRDQGRLDDAEASYQRAAQISPDNPVAYYDLGIILQELGRRDEAEACYRRTLQIKPDYADAYCNLGNILKDKGRLDEAEASYRRALQIKPVYPEALSNLGAILRDTGRLADAEACYRQALQIKPDYADAYCNLGNTLHELGRLDEAEASLRRALQLKPDLNNAYYNLGITLQDMGRLDEAEASFRQALQVKPDYVEAHNNLGIILGDMGQLDKAEASFQRALEIKPDYAEAHSNLGKTHKELGWVGKAEASYRQALQVKSDNAVARSNLLFFLNYTSGNPPTLTFEEARQFGREASNKVTTRFSEWPCAAQPERLRIGLVSGDFKNHPVGYFLESILAHLDPASVELIAYQTDHKADELTARIKPFFSGWNSLFGLSDEAAARQIHSDGVHVLIDLSGHTGHNRLPVFAWKPAPVQVSWLGYFATTGVAEIDYLIADSWTLPESEEVYFTEKIWRLPETRLCFTPPEMDTEISPLPALANGYVTFGCFNHLAKINDEVVTLWSRILESVPNSRLFLKAKQFKEASVRQRTLERFARQGIDAGQLILEGPEPRAKYMAAYQRVDIALDPFPYPGGTTSVESLWMGVPVLTLAGQSFLSRQGVGILMNAGLPEWVADDPDDYLRRAASHAKNLHGLATLRNGLRQQVMASPIMDARRFAVHLESALRGMWLERQGVQPD